MTRFGFYGLIPFVAGAVALWLSPWLLPQFIALDFHRLVLAYGAVSVAWLSGASAGVMLAPQLKSGRGIASSMLVALAAFAAIIPDGTFFLGLGAAWRHLIILLLLIYLLMRDLRATAEGRLPGWYGRLRSRLTFWAAASLTLIISRLMLWGFY